MTRAPASGFLAPCCARSAIRPGISCSARRDFLAAEFGCERSFTLKGSRPAAFAAFERVELLNCCGHAFSPLGDPERGPPTDVGRAFQARRVRCCTHLAFRRVVNDALVFSLVRPM